MHDASFMPTGNGIAIASSTVSASLALMPSSAMVVTNRSDSSAWVTWASGAVIAVFPTVGAAGGAWGIEIPPQAQITVGTSYQNATVAVVLASGTGVCTFIPGDGV